MSAFWKTDGEFNKSGALSPIEGRSAAGRYDVDAEAILCATAFIKHSYLQCLYSNREFDTFLISYDSDIWYSPKPPSHSMTLQILADREHRCFSYVS